MNKKMEAINKLAEAALAMEKAVNALNAIKDDAEMQMFIGPDAGYYRTQLEELLSVDDGEAGIKALIDMLAKKYL